MAKKQQDSPKGGRASAGGYRPPQAATPKQTGGGGYTFEDNVSAYFLAHMLAGIETLEYPRGVLIRLDAQRPAPVSPLDDLVLTLQAGPEVRRVACSVKSNPQIGDKGLPREFVGDAWNQLLAAPAGSFDPNRDYVGLFTAPVDPGLADDVYDLLWRARAQDPADLVQEVRTPRRANERVRAIYESASPPASLAPRASGTAALPGRLLARLVWVPFDIEHTPSERRKTAIALCQGSLASGSPAEAAVLWDALLGIARELRGAAGSMDRLRLADTLRQRFRLRDFPDHRADWERINADARASAEGVPNLIGGRVELPRAPERARVAEAFARATTVALLGASGSGKSAISRAEVVAALREGPALWMDAVRLEAGGLADMRAQLGLNTGVDILLRETTAPRCLAVLDGVDRLFHDASFRAVAEVVRALRLGDPATPWRLLITCQPEAWEGVRRQLEHFGVLPHPVTEMTVGNPDPDELEAVWSAFPQLRSLANQHHLNLVLLRPKVLDLLAFRAGSQAPPVEEVGESHLAGWFWDEQVARQPRGAGRSTLAMRLATELADRLLPGLPESLLGGPADLGPLDDLEGDRICVRRDGRITFGHDLYGDWARLRAIRDAADSGQLADFVARRLTSPLWHRALRLYGVHLLEHADAIDHWASAFAAVSALPEPALAQDLLLEAACFAARPAVALERLWPRLVAEDGQLLARLLERFLHSGTVPNPAVVARVRDVVPDLEAFAASYNRVPHWPYWVGIVAFLHTHSDQIPYGAWGQAARVAAGWLRWAPAGWPLRPEAAALAVALGDELLRDKERHDELSYDGEPGRAVYTAVLAAAAEEPERAAQILLEAAGRRDLRFAPRPHEDEEADEDGGSELPPSFYAPARKYAPPWPDGPVRLVDRALQHVVLNSDALHPLMKAAPALTREVLLALLIEEPREVSFWGGDRPGFGDALTLSVTWNPPFYLFGPFLPFLRLNEEEGVETILRLVQHATEHRAEMLRRVMAGRAAVAFEDVPPPSLEVPVDHGSQVVLGDATVFTWPRFGSGGIVGSALMALEKHLNDRIEANEDVGPAVARILQRTRSLAVVGVLLAVGKKDRELFAGPLKHLLTVPEVLSMDLSASLPTGGLHEFGIWNIPEPLHQEYREWHDLPHRRIDLRRLAAQLFFLTPELEALFTAARGRWMVGMEPGGPYEGWDFVEHLIPLFDKANYSPTEVEGGLRGLAYTAPQHLRDDAVASEAARGEEMAVLTLPLRSRQLLDGPAAPPAEVLEELWQGVQRMEAHPPEGDLDAPVTLDDGLAGVAALLAVRGGEWGRSDPSRAAWVRETLLRSVNEASASDGDDPFSGSMSAPSIGMDRLAFGAEALPTLWAGTPSDPALRSAIASLALHAEADVVQRLVRAAARVRLRLGPDFQRLLRLVLLRARWSERAYPVRFRVFSAERGDEEEKAAAAEAMRALNGERAVWKDEFVSGSLEPVLPSLASFDCGPDGEGPPARRAASRGRRGGRKRLPLEFRSDLLIAAFSGVPMPRAAAAEERVDLARVWADAVEYTVQRLAIPPGANPEAIEGHPNSWDRWLLQEVAAVVLDLGEDDAAALWRPLFELGATAASFVDLFARRWAELALLNASQAGVVEKWSAMIGLALHHPHWGSTVRGSRGGRGMIWRSLLGLSHPESGGWTAERTPVAVALAPLFSEWARHVLSEDEDAQALAHFLVRPAAGAIILEGLGWLHTSASVAGADFFHDGETADAVASLLLHTWESHRPALTSNPGSFAAFRELLAQLTTRRHPLSLELAQMVAVGK